MDEGKTSETPSEVLLISEMDLGKAAKPRGRNPDGPRLSEAEKKKNHIKSEKKRREGIRDGFDRFAEAIGIPGQGRSEAAVMARGTHFLKSELANRYILIQEAKFRGMDLKDLQYDPETMRLAEHYANDGYASSTLAQELEQQAKGRKIEQEREQTSRWSNPQANRQSSQQAKSGDEQDHPANPQGFPATQQDSVLFQWDHSWNEHE